MIIIITMTWIDYKIIYDLAPHTLIVKCQEMVGAADNIVALIRHNMVHWKTVQTSDGLSFGMCQ